MRLLWILLLIGYLSAKQWDYQFEKDTCKNLIKPHCVDGIYYNHKLEVLDKAYFSEMISYFGGLFTSPTRLAIPFFYARTAFEPSEKGLSIYWVGHSTCIIQMEGLTILTDPCFSDCYPMLGTTLFKRHTLAAIAVDKLPKIDVLLISHNHYDHLDEKAVYHLLEHQPQVIVPLGLKQWFESKGFLNVIEHNWWDNTTAKDFENNKITFTCLPAQHGSIARDEMKQNQSLWCSWMLSSKDNTVYFSGDTGFKEDIFYQIKSQFPQIDVALIGVGPSNNNEQHLDPHHAFIVSRILLAKKMIPIHWGAFRFDNAYLEDPILQLRSYFEKFPDCKDDYYELLIGDTYPSL